MKTTRAVVLILLTLCCALVSVFLLKELNVYWIFENILSFLKICLLSLCFVLVFEPLIEKIPVSYRMFQCLLVYAGLAVVLVLSVLLLAPLVTSQWDTIIQLFKQIRSINTNEIEMTSQIEKAMSGVIPFLQQIKDGILAYVLAFFLSLEFTSLRHQGTKYTYLNNLFLKYDCLKDFIYQYSKAMMLDISFLFVGQCLLLWIFRVDSLIALAWFLALMNIFPYFGPTLALIFVFLVDALNYGRLRVGFIVCLFVFQQIESNCIQPILYGKMMNLKPWIMFISILFFGSVFGLMGVLFAPVLAVSVQYLIFVKKSS